MHDAAFERKVLLPISRIHHTEMGRSRRSGSSYYGEDPRSLARRTDKDMHMAILRRSHDLPARESNLVQPSGYDSAIHGFHGNIFMWDVIPHYISNSVGIVILKSRGKARSRDLSESCIVRRKYSDMEPFSEE